MQSKTQNMKGRQAVIDASLCMGCGRCARMCRFGAIHLAELDGRRRFAVEPSECEGCGKCVEVCPHNAISMSPVINGERFSSDTASRPFDAQSEDSPNVVIMPPSIFLACLLAGIALEAMLPPACGELSWRLILSGGALFVAGFAFMMWGHGRFKTLGVNVKTVLPASRLVTDGAYHISRNPMYVGFLAMLAGMGLAVASVWLCAMCLPFFFYFSLYVIPREEAYLARHFGEEYAAYRAKVRRWL